MGRPFLIACFLFSSAIIGGCSPKSTETESSHIFKGRVVSVDRIRNRVEIDFAGPAPGYDQTPPSDASRGNHLVENAKLLDGLAPGDLVEVEVKVKKTGYSNWFHATTGVGFVITKLNKTR